MEKSDKKTPELQLKALYRLTGTIRVLTGLHIGAGKSSLVIGGLDLPVQRDVSGYPLIPGSSLKGKLRSFFEYRYGVYGKDGKPLDKSEGVAPEKLSHAIKILKIFGGLHDEKNWNNGPTRLKVADMPLIRGEQQEDQSKCFEEKPETAINRMTGTVQNASLRHVERVVVHTRFNLDISFRCFEEGDEALFKEVLATLPLVCLDGLGGSTSRGYGRVALENLDLQVFQATTDAAAWDISPSLLEKPEWSDALKKMTDYWEEGTKTA